MTTHDNDVLASAPKDVDTDFMAAMDRRLLRSPASYMDTYHRVFELTYARIYAPRIDERALLDRVRTKMYERLRTSLENRAKEICGELTCATSTATGLDALAKAWTSYRKGLHTLNRIAQPLHRVHIEHRQLADVTSLGEHAFWTRANRTLLPTKWSLAPLLDNWRERMLTALLSDENLSAADVRAGRMIVALVDFGPLSALYYRHVEVPLCNAAVRHCHAKAVRYLDALGIDDFDATASQWLRKEGERARVCILARDDYITPIADLLRLANVTYQRPDPLH